MNTEKFIRDATRGVSRRKRAAAQAELRSHLHERTNQLVLAGKPLPSAQAQAMAELGPSAQIARELRRSEHVHPLLSAAVLIGLLGLLSVPSFQLLQDTREASLSGRALLSATELRNDGYLSVPEARRELGGLGITLSGIGPWLQLKAKGLPSVALGDTGCGALQTAAPIPLFPEVRPSRQFVALYLLPSCLARAGWPLRVQPERITLFGQELKFAPPSSSRWTPLLQPLFWQTLLYSDKLQLVTGTGKDVIPMVKWNAPQTYAVDAAEDTLLALLVSRKEQHEKRVLATVTWVKDGQVTLPTKMSEPWTTENDTATITLFPSLTEWRKAPSTVSAGVVVPLPTNTAEPVHLTPLSLTPADM